METLVGSAVPLGARELANRLGRRLNRAIAPESVYRVLRALVRRGLVQRIESERGFAAADAGIPTSRRLSLLCTDCGRVQLRAIELDRGALPEELDRVGFVPDRYVLELRGVCARCAVTDEEERDS
jgi:Fur family zinc uptake transcriptional regulator